VHYPSPGALGPALLRMLGAYRGRLILSFHGLELQSARDAGWIESGVWRFILRHTDAVVAVSRAFGNEALEFTRGSAPVVVIHNGVDADALRANAKRASNRLTELNGRDVILTVAKIEARKGVDVLVRSFAELRRSNPRLALVVVGRPGDSSADVHSLTEALGLTDHVFFYDNVPHDEMGAFFEKAKVVCMPSRSETFGIVLLEAGVFHRPVVATRIGGIPEVIEDGENGLLVEPDDVSALTEALRRVLDDPTLAARLADRLSRRVDAEFTWKRSYADYRALVEAPPGRFPADATG
jgi:glycosyltransferase involved in cell wall biosynthesis